MRETANKTVCNTVLSGTEKIVSAILAQDAGNTFIPVAAKIEYFCCSLNNRQAVFAVCTGILLFKHRFEAGEPVLEQPLNDILLSGAVMVLGR